MFQQTFAIARNTFFESIRQPVMLVILLAATFVLVICNPLASYTLEDDQRMFVDIGLSSVFLCGAILAAFIATSVLGREIENKTALTVIAKPVSRPIFVIGKYLGVAAAMAIAVLYMSFVFLIVEQHRVLQTVRDPIHVPVIVFGLCALILSFLIAVWCNYFYSKVFGSTFICTATPLFALAYLFSLMYGPDFALRPIASAFSPELIFAAIAVLLAILVLTSIALAASTRLGQVMTLVVTILVFLAGLLSDWFIGGNINRLQAAWLERAADQNKTADVSFTRTYEYTDDKPQTVTFTAQQVLPEYQLSSFATPGERFTHRALWVAYAVVPNFQVLWLTDAVNQDRRIPRLYLSHVALYSSCHIIAALALATLLFQRREVA